MMKIVFKVHATPPGPGPVPIAQTSDGKCQVMSFKDGDSATEFTFGDDWAIAGGGLYGGGAPEGEWAFDSAVVHINDADVMFEASFSGDGTTVTLTPAPEQSIEPDTYNDVEFKYTVTNGDGDSEELTLTIPTLIVE